MWEVLDQYLFSLFSLSLLDNQGKKFISYNHLQMSWLVLLHWTVFESDTVYIVLDLDCMSLYCMNLVISQFAKTKLFGYILLLMMLLLNIV